MPRLLLGLPPPGLAPPPGVRGQPHGGAASPSSHGKGATACCALRVVAAAITTGDNGSYCRGRLMISTGPFDRPYPLFGYSESRWSAYQRCPRAYYLRVYHAWRGWDASPNDTKALAYRLKQTTTMPALIGTALHEATTTAVASVLGGGEPPSLDSMLATARGSLNAAWQAARRAHATYLVDARRPRGIMLEEFLYGDAPTGPALARYRTRLCFLLETLHHCDALWEEVRAAGSTRVIIPPPFGTLEWRDPRLSAGSVTLFAAPDLVTSSPDEIIITDVKSGRSDGVIDQLLTYTVAVADGLLPQLSVKGSVTGQVVALGDGVNAMSRCGFDPGDVVAARTRLVQNVNVLAERQADRERNMPHPVQTFRMRADVRDCVRCAFRGLCHPQLYPLAVRQPRPVAGCHAAATNWAA